MSDQPTAAELQESIDQLTEYRDRLKQDVIALGQKLRLPQKKIDASITEHAELQRIEEVLNQLMNALESQSKT